MLDPPNSEKPQNILGNLLSVISLLGATLFFTGWIYRWAYFAFFQLDLTALNLPAQSFLIVPIEIFLGDWDAIGKTILIVILAAFTIYLTLWLLQVGESYLSRRLNSSSPRSTATPPSRSSRFPAQSSILATSPVKGDILRLLQSLLTEAIIVGWIFAFLFWSARWQGTDDAWRDAHNATSTLPVITLVTPLDKAALGRQLDDVFADRSLKGFGVIGDKGLFKDLQGQEDTDITNPDKPRVWRLLLSSNGWIYLFRALPADATRQDRPSVLALKEGEGQLLILSPEPSKS